MKPLVLGALALAVASASGVAPAVAVPPADDQVRVVVQSTGDRADAVRAVEAAGGRVARHLPIVDGVSATVPESSRARVQAAPGVLAVTDDLPVSPAGTSAGVREGQQAALVETGAHTLHQTGIDGRGTTVALIDTGISRVRDLAGRVRVVPDPASDTGTAACVDFSGEDSCDDSYGHGTFVAGLIAGSGAASGGDYRGAAPAASLVSVKIAGYDGGADVTKVLAAIQWVVSFREMDLDRDGQEDPGEDDIDVLNLSLGTTSKVSPEVDPLNRAVQRAVAEGITVVVAAGNAGDGGKDSSRVFKPGDDPSVITVGAVDDLGTGSRLDDRVPAFTSRGSQGQGKPDLAAPGAHLVSLISPGSYVEDHARGVGVVDATYRRGSGSSFASALVSGMAALVEQVRPEWTPAQVKAALVATADRSRLGNERAVGAGIVRVGEAVARTPVPATVAVSSGELEDTLDASRGDVLVRAEGCVGHSTEADDAHAETLQGLLGDPLYAPVADGLDSRCSATGIRGELTSLLGDRDRFEADAFVKDWNSDTWYASQWSGNSWLGNSWLGNSWLSGPDGTAFTGNSWLGNSWLGDSSGEGVSYGQPRRGSAFYGTSE